MATITAFIRTSSVNKNKSANVRFRLRDGRGFQLFHKSEIFINFDKWDEKQQRIKSRCHIDDTERKEFDDAVNERKALITSIYLERGKMLTSEDLDAEIDKTINPKLYETKPQTLFEFIESFIKAANTRTVDGRFLSITTHRQYKSTQNHLKAFAKKLKKKDFEFSDIDLTFYDKFVDYLQTEITKVEKGETIVVKKAYSKNNVGKNIKVLKTMLYDAQAKGICYVPVIAGKKFKTLSEDADTIYLDETELQRIKDQDFSDTLYLDRARDWFLLLAWTGCRFSDLEKISKTDIKDGFITFRQQKTNNKVTIPLHPVVIEVLEKYAYNLPSEISNQKFNDYIKVVCEKAEINCRETTTKTVGGKLVTETFEKWQLVSSHTGRRSFCTNMYKRGLPTLMIMSVSGHKTEKAFLKYIKVKQSEHAEMMAKRWAEMYGKPKK